jgi:hypothetical protein
VEAQPAEPQPLEPDQQLPAEQPGAQPNEPAGTEPGLTPEQGFLGKFFDLTTIPGTDIQRIGFVTPPADAFPGVHEFRVDLGGEGPTGGSRLVDVRVTNTPGQLQCVEARYVGGEWPHKYDGQDNFFTTTYYGADGQRAAPANATMAFTPTDGLAVYNSGEEPVWSVPAAAATANESPSSGSAEETTEAAVESTSRASVAP